MTGFHLINVIVHVSCGVVGLALGLVPMCTAKGGTTHRRFGRYFEWFAGVVIGTALLGIAFGSPPPALIAAALAASYQYVGSLRALHLKGRAPNAWDALIACAGLGCVAWMFMTMGPGTPSWTPAIGYSTLGYVGALTVYDLSRHLWPRLWTARVQPLDHGLKMTGVYFAMLSAGAGNLLKDFQPWSQVLPSGLGTLVMLVLAVSYLRRPAPVLQAVPEAAT